LAAVVVGCIGGAISGIQGTSSDKAKSLAEKKAEQIATWMGVNIQVWDSVACP
jgi:hypothetical protein